MRDRSAARGAAVTSAVLLGLIVATVLAAAAIALCGTQDGCDLLKMIASQIVPVVVIALFAWATKVGMRA